MSAYQQLTEAFSALTNFEHAAVILQWDQEVMTPQGAATDGQSLLNHFKTKYLEQ